MELKKSHPPEIQKMYQEPSFNQFDLVGLAFADLIDSEIKNEPEAEIELEKPEGINIRCICGKNHYSEDIIQCSYCQCYLHKQCVDVSDKTNPGTFKCPFCKLQLDGLDPFCELKMWIDEKDSEIKSLNQKLTEVSQIDQKISQVSYDVYGQRTNTQNLTTLHNNLQKTVKEVIDHIAMLSSS